MLPGVAQVLDQFPGVAQVLEPLGLLQWFVVLTVLSWVGQVPDYFHVDDVAKMRRHHGWPPS